MRRAPADRKRIGRRLFCDCDKSGRRLPALHEQLFAGPQQKRRLLLSRVCTSAAQTIRKRIGRKRPAIPIAARESRLPQARIRFSGFLPQDFAFAYGQLSDFPDSYRRKLPRSTGKNPIFPIRTVEKPLSLRTKLRFPGFLP